MKGNRKLVVIVLYIVAVTIVGVGVLHYHYDTLMGAGLFAGGLAAGVGTFMWGNSKEHQATAAANPAQ